MTEDPAGVEAHLGGVFGQTVRIGILLGPPRANLKPVLQVFGVGGTVLGFAKVGASPGTATLLAVEAATLRWLNGHPVPGIAVPQVIDYDTWGEVPILVQAPLPMARSEQQPLSMPVDQLAALAVSGGVTGSALGGTQFWERVRKTGKGRWQDLDTSAFGRLRDAIDTDTELSLGAWHGDFGPWNAAGNSEKVEVWDWERFEADVPIGFDGAHWRVQIEFKKGTDPVDAWVAMKADVAEVVRCAGVQTDVPVTCACYVLAIWRRYRRVTEDLTTPMLRRRVTWLADLAEVASGSLMATAP